jgi:hypothetical protein
MAHIRQYLGPTLGPSYRRREGTLSRQVLSSILGRPLQSLGRDTWRMMLNVMAREEFAQLRIARQRILFTKKLE